MGNTWIGGGNNKASNPKDWSPPGVPLNQQVFMPSGTMNVTGTDLLGDDVVAGQNTTISLSKDATLRIDDSGGTVNVSGIDQVVVDGSATINLANHAQMVGGLNPTGPLFMNAVSGAVFYNGGSVLGLGGQATVNADVVGDGSFLLNGGNITFTRSVGSGQRVDTTNDGGVVQVAHPAQFQATVFFDPFTVGEIDLMGLAKVDSYTYQNDMLSIYAGADVIDTLHLVDATQHGFAVEPPTVAGSVNVVIISDPNNPPPSLPIHT